MVSRKMRRLVGAGALSTVLLGLAACGSGDDAAQGEEPASATSTSQSPSDPAGSAEVLELSIDQTAARAKCMVPNAEVLATQDSAFEGTVTEVSDGTATLSVDRWFSQDTGARTVSVSTPSDELPDLLVAVDFQEGRTYLVSSLDGRVSLCGFTGESSPQLEALYLAAFPG